jgi:hypothetical protein
LEFTVLQDLPGQGLRNSSLKKVGICHYICVGEFATWKKILPINMTDLKATYEEVPDKWSRW